MREVFLTNKTYSNYNEVLELIKGAVKKTVKEGDEPLTNILSILDDAKESISQSEQDAYAAYGKEEDK